MVFESRIERLEREQSEYNDWVRTVYIPRELKKYRMNTPMWKRVINHILGLGPPWDQRGYDSWSDVEM